MTTPLQVTFSFMKAVETEAEQATVKLPPDIWRVKEVVLFRGDPVTVIVWVPTWALGVIVKVMTEVQAGAQP